jgi:hypothetical protein
MREIRARIAKGSGLDITNQQIHELAARRLEAILDPRTVKPALLEQLRRGAVASETPAPAAPPPIEVNGDSLSASFFQRLFRPLAALLAPILQALRTQATINKEAAEREASANRRQAEWNALQFELLQRMVSETARVSIEMQGLTLRIESLSTKVDFNERRVRTLENTAPPPRSPQARQLEPVYTPPPRETPVYVPPPPPAAAPAETPAPGLPGSAAGAAGDATVPARKRRRRRRGRRTGGAAASGPFAVVAGSALALHPGDGAETLGDDQDADVDLDEPGDDEPPMPAAVETAAAPPDAAAAVVPVDAAPPDVAPPVPAPFSDAEPAPVAPVESRTVVWQQVTSAPEPAAAPEQPMPPRDEAAPGPEPTPPAEPPDPGPADR